MLRSITAKQLVEWRMFEMLEPFGPEREDLRIASVVATLLNIHRDRTKKPFDIADCIIKFGDAAPPAKGPKSKGQDWRIMKAVAVAMGEK
jgi:hypothetical protein